MDWLRDPIWQFIGILVGLTTFVIAAFWQRKRKKIAYEIISNTQLLSVKDEVKSHLQILFDQKPVYNLNLVVLKIYNAGNEPISPEDFKDKLTVEFGDKRPNSGGRCGGCFSEKYPAKNRTNYQQHFTGSVAIK